MQRNDASLLRIVRADGGAGAHELHSSGGSSY